MPNSFHKNLVGTNLHALPAEVYADIAARDADTWNQSITNVNKMVRVDSIPPSYYMLVGVPGIFSLDMAGSGHDTFIELTDTPGAYGVGDEGKATLVNDTLDGLVFGQKLRTTDSPTFDGMAYTTGTITGPISFASINTAFKPNRGTVLERDAFLPEESMQWYNFDAHQMEHYNGTVWVNEAAGSGDVIGPASSLDNQLPKFNLLTGKVLQGSNLISDDDSWLNLTSTQAGGGRFTVNETGLTGINIPGFAIFNKGSQSGRFQFAEATDTVDILTSQGIKVSISADGRIEGSNTKFGLQLGATFGGVAGNPDTIGAIASTGSLRVSTDSTNSQALDMGIYTAVGAWIQARNAGDLSADSPLVLQPNGNKAGVGGDPTAFDTFTVQSDVPSGGRIGVNESGVAGLNHPGFHIFNEGGSRAFFGWREQSAQVGIWNSLSEPTITIDVLGKVGIGTGNSALDTDVKFMVADVTTVVQRLKAISGKTMQFLSGNQGSVISADSFLSILSASDNDVSSPNGSGIFLDAIGQNVRLDSGGSSRLNAGPFDVSVVVPLKLSGFGVGSDGNVQSATNLLTLGNSTAPSLVGILDFNFGIGTNIPTEGLHVVLNTLIESSLFVEGVASVGLAHVGTPNISLSLTDTDRSLKLNNTTTVQRDAYATPLPGMAHYNSDLDTPEVYNDARARFETVKSPQTVYVNSFEDFPTPVAGWIQLEANTRYIGNNHLSVIDMGFTNIEFAENSRLEFMSLQMFGHFGTLLDIEFRSCIITYLGTATLLDFPSLAGISAINSCTFLMGAAGTLFNIGSSAQNTALLTDSIGIVGNSNASLGTISGITVGMTTTRALLFGQGLIFGECFGIDVSKYVSVGSNVTDAVHLSFSGTNQRNIQVSGFSPTVQALEHAFFFDPATAYVGFTTVSDCTVNLPTKVFFPTSLDQTSIGFKFLGNSNIPDSTVAVHTFAPPAGTQTTILTQNEIKRILAVYLEVAAERFQATGGGNWQYLGNERVKLLLSSNITGQVSSGTNVPFSFYLAKLPAGVVIAQIADQGGGLVRVTTNISNGFLNEDTVILENTVNGGEYDGSFGITVINPTQFDIIHAFTQTSTGLASQVQITSRADNFFSGVEKSTGVVTLIDLQQNDAVFLCVQNTGSSANWEHSNIQAVLTKV